MKIGNSARNRVGRFWPIIRDFRLWVFCLAALVSVTDASADDPFIQPTAITQSGLVMGSTTTGGINEFLGIPYAAPPVGTSRWTPPKPYGSFPRFLWQATQFGSECTQPGGIGSEDCLFLNVYTPANQPRVNGANLRERGLPVMFWIHGGSLRRAAAILTIRRDWCKTE